MYPWTVWVDETDQYEDRYTETMNGDGTISHVKVRGEVYVQGTPQDAAHFNLIEQGVVDAHTAIALLMNDLRQHEWESDDRLKWLEKSTAQETGSA